jgi:hypothetical protein
VNGHALVTEIQPDAARTAFRIHYPVAAALGASRSRRSTLELLFHNNAIWWPYGGSLYATTLDDYEGQRTFRHAKANEWCVGIGRDRDLLRMVPRGTTIARTETESRVSFPDGAGETVARVQRTLEHNYLVCRNLVYARGGVPIHAQWKEGNRRTIVVTSSGCDRAVTGRHDLYSPPASFERWKNQQALYEGRFWMPGAQDEARRRLTKSQSGCPGVEVCIPDAVSGDSRRDIQVDALFREVRRLLSYILHYAVVTIRKEKLPLMPYSNAQEFANATLRTFEAAVAPKADAYATTTSRTEALRSLLSCGPALPKRHGHMSASTACLLAFRDLERQYPRELIADEDMKALEDIGSFP